MQKNGNYQVGGYEHQIGGWATAQQLKVWSIQQQRWRHLEAFKEHNLRPHPLSAETEPEF